MVERQVEKQRVDPSILQTALLDEIAERLLAIQQHQQRETEEGIVEPLRPITVTTSPVTVHPPYREKLWFGVKITNNGPESVWIIVNTEKSPPTPQEVMAEETWGVKFSTPVIEDLYMYTDTGTAVVRIRGER